MGLHLAGLIIRRTFAGLILEGLFLGVGRGGGSEFYSIRFGESALTIKLQLAVATFIF